MKVIWKRWRILFGLLLLVSGLACTPRPESLAVIYLIPEGFEGAVLIVYDENGGTDSHFDGRVHTVTVPNDGVVRIGSDQKTFSGPPRFYYFDAAGSRREVEYLAKTRIDPESSKRSENDLSDHERKNLVFAMNYDYGVLNSGSREIVFRSFLICKVEDANRFAATELSEKRWNYLRRFPQ